MLDTRAFVVHSDTGTPLVECASVTEAYRVRDRLERAEGDRYHVQPVADLLTESAVV
jgi:hypothetical protein